MSVCRRPDECPARTGHRQFRRAVGPSRAPGARPDAPPASAVSMPTPSSLTSRTSRRRSASTTTSIAVGVGVLDGVDDELLGNGEQDSVDERSVIDRVPDGELDRRAAGNGATAAAATPRIRARGPSRDGTTRSSLASLRSPRRGDRVARPSRPRPAASRCQPLHRAVMQRLGEARALATLSLQHLGEQPVAIGGQPRHLAARWSDTCRSASRSSPLLERVADGARKRDRDYKRS